MAGRLRESLLRIEGILLPPDEDLGRLPYAWLIYLGFLFFPLTLGVGGAAFWVPTLLSIVVFLPLYFWAFRLSGWKVLIATIPMVLLCALLVPYNHSALTFGVYAAAFAPGLGSVRTGLIHLIGVIVAISVVFWFHTLPTPFFLMGILMPLLVGISNIYFNEMHKKNAQIKLSQQEVRRLAGKAERERIARDLHDLLGHTLSVMVRKAELARRLAPNDAGRAASEMADVEEIGRQAWPRYAGRFRAGAPRNWPARQPVLAWCWSPPALPPRLMTFPKSNVMPARFWPWSCARQSRISFAIPEPVAVASNSNVTMATG
jgi:two-component system, NarL family, sensor histidine kinase DesK